MSAEKKQKTESTIPSFMFENKAFVSLPAPDFSCDALLADGQFGKVSLSDYKNKWVCLYFYPLDFTFICPTEILAFSKAAKQFADIDCAIVGVSVDSVFSHLAWCDTPADKGGLGGNVGYPLISDLNKQMSKDYGVLMPDGGHALRGLFIIDDKGIVRHITKNDPPVGRSTSEVLRVVQGYQFNDKHPDSVCPANWVPGEATIDVNNKLEYFSHTK